MADEYISFHFGFIDRESNQRGRSKEAGLTPAVCCIKCFVLFMILTICILLKSSILLP